MIEYLSQHEYPNPKISINDFDKSILIDRLLTKHSKNISKELLFQTDSMMVLSFTHGNVNGQMKFFIQVRNDNKYIIYTKKNIDIFDIEYKVNDDSVKLSGINATINALVGHQENFLVLSGEEKVTKSNTTVQSLDEMTINAVDDKKFVKYLNNFRKNIASVLKPDIAIKSTIFPYQGGSLIQMELTDTEFNSDKIGEPSRTLDEALDKAEIELFGEDDIKITIFPHDTSIIVEEDVIYIIKKFSENGWTEEQAKSDVDKIIHGLNLN